MYFTNDTDTLHHSGKEVGVIKTGDLQTTINEKLAAEIILLKEELARVRSAPTQIQTTTDNIVNVTGFGVTNEYEPTNMTLTVKTTAAADGVTYFYNIPDIQGLPGQTLNNRVIVENGSGTIVVNTDKASTSFTLAPNNFPAYISFDIRRTIDQTTTEYYLGKAQLNQTQDVVISLEKKRFGGTEIKSQTEVNNYLYNKVGELQKNQNNKITFGNQGDISLQESVNRLLTDVENLKKTLDISAATVTYNNDGSGNVQKTISEALSEIATKVNTL